MDVLSAMIVIIMLPSREKTHQKCDSVPGKNEDAKYSL
jgi:hypothetical protein